MSSIAMTTETTVSHAAEVETTRPFFSVRDMHAYYGESYIVQGVSLDVRKGEILALLGRNGAGKTSTLRTIARTDNPQMRQGEIWLDGMPIHQLKSFEAARSGIQLVPEDRRIIQGLTVEENINLAKVAPGNGWSLEQIYESFPRLAERRTQEGVTLSGGEQQMLAIARALAGNPELLMLDEPSQGLAPRLVHELEALLVRLKGEGVTILLVEQNARMALGISDRVLVLGKGAVVFAGGTRRWRRQEAELKGRYLSV